MSVPESSNLQVRVRVPLGRFELDVDVALNARSTGLFGASGTGKTTLLEVIAGLRRNASGTVTFGGARWLDGTRSVPPEQRGIGYVPQEGLLFPHWTVRQNLLAGARRSRRSGAGPVMSVDEVARLLEVTALLDQSATVLSGGERQRVALGRALCSAPALLLLDEPFGALDLPLRRRLLPLLERVVAASRVPLVIVSHDPSELAALCDEVVVLSNGGVAAQGDAQALLTDPDLHGGTTRTYDNVLIGRASAVVGDLVHVHVGAATSITVRHAGLREGDPVVLSLRAQDVMVGTEAPQGLSARNVFPARIERIRGSGRRWLTAAIDDEVKVVVELTDAACQQLELHEGAAVHLIFKATSCRVSAPRR